MDGIEQLRKEGSWDRRTVTGREKNRHVVVPPEWVTAWDLIPKERGQETVNVIYFAEDNFFLTITPISARLRNTVTIWIEDTPITSSSEERAKTKRKILAAYLVGYQRILIKKRKGSMPQDFLEEIERFAKGKLACTLVDSGASEIIIKVSIDWEGIPVDDQIKNMCRYVKQMHRNTVELMKEFSSKKAKAIIDADDKVDQLCHLMVRLCKTAAQNPAVIRFARIGNFRRLMAYRVIAKSLERCADHAVRMAMDLRELHENTIPSNAEFDRSAENAIENLSKDMFEVLEEAMNALFASSNNYVRAEAIIQRIDQIRSANDSFIYGSCVDEVSLRKNWCQRRLVESITRALLYIETIAEITLNLYIDSVVEVS